MFLFTHCSIALEGLKLIHSPACLIPSLQIISFASDLLDNLLRFSFIFKFTKEKILSQSALDTGIVSNARVNLERIGYFLL